MKLSARDEARLTGLHSDLVRVIRRAASITPLPFMVIEGMRTIETQRKYVAQGASKTMRSRHLTGHAIDIAPLVDGKPSWAWPLYHRLAVHVKNAANVEKVAITWGGDWVRFRDGPHWELSWKEYP